jgi:putative Ca2+/H+ antiporter (TMEM165/GDT1 family)
MFEHFGFRLIYDSSKMESGRASDELEEVEEELLQQSNKKEDVEEGLAKQNSHVKSQTKSWYQVAFLALSLTLVAEWGDRSQIATIALAAAKNPVGVTVGGCLGALHMYWFGSHWLTHAGGANFRKDCESVGWRRLYHFRLAFLLF